MRAASRLRLRSAAAVASLAPAASAPAADIAERASFSIARHAAMRSCSIRSCDSARRIAFCLDPPGGECIPRRRAQSPLLPCRRLAAAAAGSSRKQRHGPRASSWRAGYRRAGQRSAPPAVASGAPRCRQVSRRSFRCSREWRRCPRQAGRGNGRAGLRRQAGARSGRAGPRPAGTAAALRASETRPTLRGHVAVWPDGSWRASGAASPRRRPLRRGRQGPRQTPP